MRAVFVVLTCALLTPVGARFVLSPVSNLELIFYDVLVTSRVLLIRLNQVGFLVLLS